MIRSTFPLAARIIEIHNEIADKGVNHEDPEMGKAYIACASHILFMLGDMAQHVLDDYEQRITIGLAMQELIKREYDALKDSPKSAH